LENSYQKFTQDVFIIGIASVLTASSGIVLLPLISKTLGAGDYGIWVQVNVTINLVMSFVGLGLPFAMTRFLAAEKNKKEIQEGFYSIFSFTFLATLIISSLIIIFSNYIAKVFFDGATVVVIITGFIILAWSLDLVCLTLFRTFRQMRKYVLFITVDIFSQIGIIAYLLLNGYGLSSILLSVLAIRLAIFFALFFLTKSQIGIKMPRFSRIKEYLNFGLPTVPSSMAAWIASSSDRYVIGYFLGAASVGVYSAGYVIGAIPHMIAIALGFVLTPTLSKLYDENRMDKVKTHLSYSVKYLLAIAIPFVFGAAILAKPVLSVFSNSQIATEGYFVMPLVALGTLFMATYVPIAHILILVKKTKVIGFIWILCSSVNLGLNILIVPRLGILGAALTTLIAYLLALIMGSYYSFKEFKFDIDWRFIIKSLFASAIMALVVWVMHSQSNLNTIITVLVGVAVYGVAIFLLRGFAKEEISFFRELVRRRGPPANPDDKAK
jgi:O-antigen/teichoic acid export membrane protein